MTAKADKGRTQPCTAADASKRMQDARKFLEVAKLVAYERDQVYSSPAAALAVLAGIAASDAACCKALGRRSRAEDHLQAVTLVVQLEPTGKQMSKSLARLLDLKDLAQYGLFDVSGKKLQTALRQAEALVKLAEEVLQR